MAMSKRVNIYIPGQLLERIDQESETNCISRSAMLTFILNDYFKQKDSLATMKEIQAVVEALRINQETQETKKGGNDD